MPKEKSETRVFDTFEEAARAAVMEIAVPRKRVGWHVWAFEPLEGRRPSRVLERYRSLIRFLPVIDAMHRLSDLCVGPPLLRPVGRAVTVREVGLAAPPAPPAGGGDDRDAIDVQEGQVILSNGIRRKGGFVFDESARASAEEELWRCFRALTKRSDGLAPRDWWLLQESGRLEDREAWTEKAWTTGGWSSEEKRAAALSELDGRSPGAIRVALSRGRRKQGERRHRGTERARRI
jgi:hypothetical protein